MAQRVLRPRKQIEIVALQPKTVAALSQPAKRNRRAISTIERGALQSVCSVSTVSTQTDNCLLSATNAKLVEQLIEKNRMIEEKDQQYIQMLERFFLMKERLTAETSEQSEEIARLTETIRAIRAEPLVHLVNDGRLNYMKRHVKWMH